MKQKEITSEIVCTALESYWANAHKCEDVEFQRKLWWNILESIEGIKSLLIYAWVDDEVREDTRFLWETALDHAARNMP